MSQALTDRLTAAIKVAEQSVAQARYQADYKNWTETLRLLQDLRDHLAKPQIPSDEEIKAIEPILQGLKAKPLADADTYTADFKPISIVPDPNAVTLVKLDGRTKEARAAKAANG